MTNITSTACDRGRSGGGSNSRFVGFLAFLRVAKAGLVKLHRHYAQIAAVPVFRYLQILFASNRRQPFVLDDQHIVRLLRRFGAAKYRAGGQILGVAFLWKIYKDKYRVVCI